MGAYIYKVIGHDADQNLLIRKCVMDAAKLGAIKW